MMTTLLFVGEKPKTNNSQKNTSYQGTSLDLCEGIAAQIFH